MNRKPLIQMLALVSCLLLALSCVDKETSRLILTSTMYDISGKQSNGEFPPELEKYSDIIEKSILPFIRLKGKIQATSAWESKLGGYPYFPLNTAYPHDTKKQPMRLLAQINFEEVPDIGLFPAKGILEFFISSTDDVYGLNFDEPTKQKDFRIIYFPQITKDNTKLVQDFTFTKISGADYFVVSKEARLSFSIDYKPVATEDFRFENYFRKAPYEFFEEFGEKQDELWQGYAEASSANGHKLGGYAFFTQSDPRSLTVNNYDVLLLQIDSDEDLEIIWGDMGVANFFIKKQDLEKADFSNVLYNWDCY